MNGDDLTRRVLARSQLINRCCESWSADRPCEYHAGYRDALEFVLPVVEGLLYDDRLVLNGDLWFELQVRLGATRPGE